jgi:hypothetical protein
MKPLLKAAIAKAILFAITASAHAVTTNTQASNYFTDANGNVGFVYVTRKTDPATAVTTTNLSYSFCVQTTAASCLEGNGVIPNNAFTGRLTINIHRADRLKLLADTTIAGFVNTLCNGPDPFGGCTQGTSPATGGLISLTYVKKRGYIEIFTFSDFKRENFKVTLNSSDQTAQGPASVQGMVLGTNVANDGASWGLEILGNNGSHNGEDHAKAMLGKTMSPQTLRRLERLTGKTNAR